MTRSTQGFRLAAALTTLVALPVPVSAQCAMCRTLLGTPEGKQLVAGFQEGILLLLAAPFLAFGTIAYLAVRARRKSAGDSG